jgi:hypothetical protein
MDTAQWALVVSILSLGVAAASAYWTHRSVERSSIALMRAGADYDAQKNLVVSMRLAIMNTGTRQLAVTQATLWAAQYHPTPHVCLSENVDIHKQSGTVLVEPKRMETIEVVATFSPRQVATFALTKEQDYVPGATRSIPFRLKPKRRFL